MARNYKNIPPVQMMPELYNIAPCMNQKHPEYHPSSMRYTDYWETQEERCVEGFWFEDVKPGDPTTGGWRYMPGNLYYYINFCVIDAEDEKGNSVKVIHPLLRDVDWILTYGWITARGFSGFEEDEEFTCHRIVKKIEDNIELTPKERDNLHKIDHIHKIDGTYKTYIESRKYLYQTHDRNLGKALYDNTAKNFFVLGSRGFGKSFYMANAIIGHEYNFYGKKYYDDEYLDEPAGVEIFVGAAMASKSSDLLKKFSKTQERLKKQYGSWGSNDEFIPGFFYNNSTGSLMPNSGTSSYRHEYDYQEGTTWLKGGTGTSIKHGIFTSENPQAAVGTRPTVMAIEEVGLVKNLLEVQGANQTCMIRDNKFGSAVYVGTAGNMEKITEPKIIFEDPEVYDMVAYNDDWEMRSKPIGLFIPAYYVDNSFKDENGNTKLEKALEEELYQRSILEKASNSSALDQYMMSRPLVPSEMFLSPDANVFPTAKLRQRLSAVETQRSEMFATRASIGDIQWEPGKRSVRWMENLSNTRLHIPIIKLNLDSYKGNYNSAVVIYEHPEENIPNPTYRSSLYKVVYDPIKDDGEGTSLASILVYKGHTANNWNSGLQDAIVAEYIGRYDQVYDIHDLCLKIAHYYNALILVENNLPGFIRYCKSKGYVHKLMLNPSEAISKAQTAKQTKYEWGVTMSGPLNIHSEQLIRQWLLEPWKNTFVSEDLQETVLYTTIDKIFSPRLLTELIAYNRDGNFDHVSSMKLLMLWLSQEREDMTYDAQLEGYDPYEELSTFSSGVITSYIKPKKSPWFN